MKILHSADWHLDSPLQGYSDSQKAMLRQGLLAVPGKVAELCRRESCQMMLLAGDLFDGAYSRESYRAVYRALEEVQVPVFVAPGNHDYMGMRSPWEQEIWPDNVYIFSRQQVESVAVPELDCRVYGAGFTGMDCTALLENFRLQGQETYHLGVFHGDPAASNSPYNPVSTLQVQQSGLSYLALGHIHKAGSFRAADTLCAWPGCPMGRGFDETGEKGVLIAEIGQHTLTRFVPLNLPEFWSMQAEAGENPQDTLQKILPSVGNENFYRITLLGECGKVDIPALMEAFGEFPNLQLRDETREPLDIWKNAGQDSFEGIYFGLLQKALEEADPEEKETILLAARISRQILEGQEVKLP